jgi:hypothetical protein
MFFLFTSCSGQVLLTKLNFPAPMAAASVPEATVEKALSWRSAGSGDVPMISCEDYVRIHDLEVI